MRSSSPLCRRVCAGLFALALSFAAASTSAQDAASATVQGRVTDESGGAIPGVTISVTSPALQVPQSTVTDAGGNYRVVNLPVGAYRVTYELTGFQTSVREDLRLSVGFVAKVDIVLKIGSLNETVTVSGESPVVDVANTSASTNFPVETLESLPKGRGLFDLIPMASGVSIAAAPDVGDSNLANRSNISTYGVVAQPTILVEGINIQTGSQFSSAVYFDYFAFDEVQIKAAGNDAEVSAAGVSMTAVVKSGGNDFHGTYATAYEAPWMQSSNITPELRAQGLNQTDPLKKYYDAAGDLGGRLIRDKLWFYAQASRQRLATGRLGFAEAPGADGRFLTADDVPGTYDSYLNNTALKLSYQLSKNNKFMAVHQYGLKLQPQMGAGRLTPLEATQNYRDPTGVWKGQYQASPNNKVLVDVNYGWGGYFADYKDQDFSNIPGNPSKRESTTGLNTGPHAAPTQRPRDRYQGTGSLSFFPAGTYLGGRHQLKVGTQLTWESAGTGFIEKLSGDYQLQYTNNVPNQIAIYNYPIVPDNHMNTQAFYAKDTWSYDRVTLNLGVRWDRMLSFLPDQTKEAGQFSSATTFQGRDILTWTRFTPRVGVAWDVRGNGRTVVKTTYGSYNYAMGDDYAQAFNPAALTTTTYRWRDLNNNGNYDPNEVDFSLSGPDFVSITGASNQILDQDLKQPITFEYTANIQRELMRNTALGMTYVHKRVQDQFNTYNVLRPYNLYTVSVPRQDPGPDRIVGTADDGPLLNLFDYPTAYRGAAFVGNKDTTVPDGRDDFYHSIEGTLTRRMANKWSALASFWTTKTHRWIGANPQGPNDDLYPIDETWTWEGRANGTYRFPYGINVSGVLRAQRGNPGQRTGTFSLPQSGTVTLRLSPFGSERGPVIAVLNLRASKRVTWHGRRLDLNYDLFNVTNTAAATATSYLSGPTYGFATTVVSPRVMRFGLGFNF